MRFAAFAMLLILSLRGSNLCAAEPISELPEKDSDRAVRYTSELEANPLGNDAMEQRQWLLQWLVATPDYTVTICDILGPLPSEELPYGPELLVQQMFGNVAYQIKNPGVRDQGALQLAAIRSVLRAYSTILASDLEVQHPFFDELLAKQAAGELERHLLPNIEKACASEPET